MNRFSCNSLLSEWELSKTKCEYYRSYQISNSYYRLQLWWQWCWWSSVEQSDKLVKLVCKSKTAAELAPELVSNWLLSPAMRINYIAGVDNAKSTTYPNIFCCPQRLQEHPWACSLFFVPFCYFLVTFSTFIAWIPKHILYWIYSADVGLQTCLVFTAKRLILANLVSHFSVNFEGFPRKPIQSIN